MQARKGERGCMPITWTPKDQMQAAKAADARGWWVQFLLCPGWRKRVRFAFASEFGYGELVLGFGFVAFVAFASFRCVGSMLMRHTFGILSIVTHTHTLSSPAATLCCIIIVLYRTVLYYTKEKDLGIAAGTGARTNAHTACAPRFQN